MIDSDPSRKRVPDPVPSFYYARSPGAAASGGVGPGQGVKSSLAPVRRSRRLWTAVLLVMGVIVGAVWIVQAPSRPLFGLLGVLPLAVVVGAVAARVARAPAHDAALP